MRSVAEGALERPLDLELGEVVGDEPAVAETAAQAEPPGRPRGTRGGTGACRVRRLLHHLQQDQIHAAPREQLAELDVGRLLGRGIGITRRVEARRQARQACRDGDGRAASLSRPKRGVEARVIDLLEALGEAGALEDESRRRERVRRDDVGAGLDVVGVHARDELRIGDGRRRAPGVRVQRESAPAKLAARAAVDEHDAAAGELF